MKNMKNLTLLFILVLISVTVIGQEIQKVAKAKDEVLSIPADTVKHWFINGSGNLAFSQAAFSNWAAGGENSIGLNAFVNLKANYKKGRHAWGNTVDLGYGFQLQGNEGDQRFTKTNDKIELTSAYGYQIKPDGKWLFTVLVNFRTQFAEGFNYPDDSTIISKFMSPGYLVAGVGITYAPVKWFYVYLSPCSGRFTFVLDQALADSGSFGVERGKNIMGEFGPYLRADMNKDLAKNINLSTTLELFTDYLKDFGNIDVNWSLRLTMNVNNWLAASIATQLIYDDDILIKTASTSEAKPHTQFKEILGIGLTYKFNQ
jgi:hypothetical protein